MLVGRCWSSLLVPVAPDEVLEVNDRLGDGWLIFALPPAELAAHPTEEAGHHELYLMCHDVHATVDELKSKQVEFSRPISDEGFGLVTAIKLGGGELVRYEPRHPTPSPPKG